MASVIEWQSQLQDHYILDFERALEVRRRRNKLLAEWIFAHGRRNDPTLIETIMRIGSEEPTDAGYSKRITQEAGGMLASVGAHELQERMRSLLFVAAEELAHEHERRLDKG